MGRRTKDNDLLFDAKEGDLLPSAHGGVCKVYDAAGRLVAMIDPKTRVRQPVPSAARQP